jgi:hypothetical protein
VPPAMIALLLILASLGASGGGPPADGDRQPAMTINYPAESFTGKGGRILDITRPPCNAKGDGSTDDTQAFIAAHDFVAGKLREHGWSDNQASYTIYIPRGTYLVSDTLIHGGTRLQYKDGTGGLARLRLVGQDRRKTIIRLRDGCPGFGPGETKPVERKAASPEAAAAWDAKLRARVAEEAKAGRPPSFRFVALGHTVSVLELDAAGIAKLSGGGSTFTWLWADLAPADRKGLAVSLAESGARGDIALAAFFGLAAGDERAESYLRKLPEKDAEEVRAAFR